MGDKRPAIAIYFEHPDWFRQLFADAAEPASLPCSSHSVAYSVTRHQMLRTDFG
jgi:hypothetical protein